MTFHIHKEAMWKNNALPECQSSNAIVPFGFMSTAFALLSFHIICWIHMHFITIYFFNSTCNPFHYTYIRFSFSFFVSFFAPFFFLAKLLLFVFFLFTRSLSISSSLYNPKYVEFFYLFFLFYVTYKYIIFLIEKVSCSSANSIKEKQEKITIVCEMYLRCWRV